MPSSALGNLLPLLLLVAVFYFLVLRPARTRQRQALHLQSSLAPGQEVITGAGLFGRVVAVHDDAVVLETAPGVTSRWAKPAIARILTDAATGGVGSGVGSGVGANTDVATSAATGPVTSTGTSPVTSTGNDGAGTGSGATAIGGQSEDLTARPETGRG